MIRTMRTWRRACGQQAASVCVVAGIALYVRDNFIVLTTFPKRLQWSVRGEDKIFLY